MPEHATKLQRLSQIHIKEQVGTVPLSLIHAPLFLILSFLTRHTRLTFVNYSSDTVLVIFPKDQTEAQSLEVKKLFEEYNKMVPFLHYNIK